MPDPGWDIPGVDRDASPGGLLTGTSAAAATTAAGADGSGSGARPARTGRTTRRDGSVSAASGLSAGAFAPAGDSDSASASPAAGSPAGSPAAGSSAAAASSADCSDGCAADEPARAGAGCGPADGSSAAAPSSASDCSDGCAADESAHESAHSDGSAAGASARPGSGSGSADRPYVTAGSYGAGGVRPSDAAQALAFVSAGLEFLAHDDAALWPEGLQADCLRVLAAAQSRQVAAHARVLAAFSVPGGGLSGDGHRSPRVWLSWQCQATARAAAAQVGWMRRLGRAPPAGGGAG